MHRALSMYSKPAAACLLQKSIDERLARDPTRTCCERAGRGSNPLNQKGRCHVLLRRQSIDVLNVFLIDEVVRQIFTSLYQTELRR